MLCLLFVCNGASAQKLKTYSGAMDGFTKVTYTYYENADGERIWHGTFTGVTMKGQAILKKITGTFKNGRQTGTWNHLWNGNSYKETLLINYNDNGVPNGQLKYTFYDKKKARVSKQLIATLADNVITGPFSGVFDCDLPGGYYNRLELYSAYRTFTGSADNGVRTGTWKLIAKKDGITYTCYEKWDANVLQDKYIIDSSTGDKAKLKYVKKYGIGEAVNFLIKFAWQLQFVRGAEELQLLPFAYDGSEN